MHVLAWTNFDNPSDHNDDGHKLEFPQNDVDERFVSGIVFFIDEHTLPKQEVADSYNASHKEQLYQRKDGQGPGHDAVDYGIHSNSTLVTGRRGTLQAVDNLETESKQHDIDDRYDGNQEGDGDNDEILGPLRWLKVFVGLLPRMTRHGKQCERHTDCDDEGNEQT